MCTHALEVACVFTLPLKTICSHYSTDLDLTQKIDNLFTAMIGDEQVLPFALMGHVFCYV